MKDEDRPPMAIPRLNVPPWQPMFEMKDLPGLDETSCWDFITKSIRVHAEVAKIGPTSEEDYSKLYLEVWDRIT